MVICHRGIGVAVKFCESVYVLPDTLVIGMENVGTVAVDLNALHFLGVDVAADVAALVDYQHGFPGVYHLLGKGRTVQARADDQIVIVHRK